MSGAIFNLYLACNMLIASLVPGGRPRETISGRVGRCWPDGRLARLIDALHPWEPDHCRLTAAEEKLARCVLYTARVDRH